MTFQDHSRLSQSLNVVLH